MRRWKPPQDSAAKQASRHLLSLEYSKVASQPNVPNLTATENDRTPSPAWPPSRNRQAACTHPLCTVACQPCFTASLASACLHVCVLAYFPELGSVGADVTLLTTVQVAGFALSMLYSRIWPSWTQYARMSAFTARAVTLVSVGYPVFHDADGASSQCTTMEPLLKSRASSTFSRPRPVSGLHDVAEIHGA